MGRHARPVVICSVTEHRRLANIRCCLMMVACVCVCSTPYSDFTKKFVEHAFSIAAPKVWNNLPLHVHTAENA